MPPAPFTAAVTSTATSTAAAELQKLESTYGPQAHVAGQAALAAYFAGLPIVQTISVFLTAFFIAITIYILVKTNWLPSRVERFRDVAFKSDMSRKRARNTWANVERHFFAGDTNDLKIAVMEADTLLDEALRNAGVQGSQLGERLKRIGVSELPNIDDVWQAHKLRNRIAHEADLVLKRDLAERALTIYETALEHLGVLEPVKEDQIKK